MWDFSVNYIGSSSQIYLKCITLHIMRSLFEALGYKLFNISTFCHFCIYNTDKNRTCYKNGPQLSFVVHLFVRCRPFILFASFVLLLKMKTIWIETECRTCFFFLKLFQLYQWAFKGQKIETAIKHFK